MDIAFEQYKHYAQKLKLEEGIDYTEKGKDVIQVMLDAYCIAKDTNDTHRMNLYFSGLMLRFWYTIGKLQARSPNLGLEYGDFMTWLEDAIEYACKYRAWQDPSRKVNAQQAINQCIETIRVQRYYEFNLQKNKVNQMTCSLDAEIDGGGNTTLLDTMVDEEDEADRNLSVGEDAAHSMVQACINKKKIVEAIILDTIAFNDVERETKTVVKGQDADGNPTKETKVYKEFWPFRCVQLLSTLPADYATYFKSHYHVLQPELEAALTAIRAANNQKLYRYLEKTLKGAREAYQQG